MVSDSDDPKLNAEGRDISTLYNEAASYFHEYGKKENYKYSVNKWLIAAELGDVCSMYALGRYYDGGGGIPKSFDEAIVVSQKGPKSMSHGSRSSIVQNFNESIKWFTLAASKGHVGAQIDLGQSYYSSTLKDTAEACRWYKLAAKSGNPIAQFELAFRFYYRDTTKEGRAKTLQLLNASAEQDYPDALLILARIYKEGHLVELNYDKSFDLFRKANQNNDRYANYELGECYFQGLGVERNYTEAVKFFKNDWLTFDYHSLAPYYLGYCYYHGLGVNRNIEEAISWLEIESDDIHDRKSLLLEEIRKYGNQPKMISADLTQTGKDDLPF